MFKSLHTVTHLGILRVWRQVPPVERFGTGMDGMERSILSLPVPKERW
jgi:hypothetical protein